MRLLYDLAAVIPPLGRLRKARDLLLQEQNSLSAQLRQTVAELDAVRSAQASPFSHYNTLFDPREVMRRHAVQDLTPTPGYLTNYLGVRIDPKFFPSILDGKAGQVEAIPIPANWHADIAEWGAALRAVDLARDTFTIIELGCGWGCWLNNTGVAARNAGKKVRLIGVEGDRGHIGFAREACATNGFRADQLTLHHGIAAVEAGYALFPKQNLAGTSWGLEPVFGATEEQRANAVRTGQYEELPMVALADLCEPHTRIDLLHVDIQGGEADLLSGSIEAVTRKVAYMVVGTHSRSLEGRIFQTMLDAGWRLEIERPAILNMDNPAVVTVDGVQGWRNSKLLP